MSRQRRLNILAGLAVFILLAGVVFLMRAGGPLRPEAVAHYRVTAYFRNVDGIRPGSEVLLAGIPIGGVAALELAEDGGRVGAVLALDPRFPLPLDSRARILTNGLFGEKYIRIEPGYEPDSLQPGDSFDYTDDSLALENFLQKLVTLREAAASPADGERAVE